MKANVFDLEEYRRKLNGDRQLPTPKVIWFYSASNFSEGEHKSFTCPVIVPDGDAESVINAIREFGGVVSEVNGNTVFLPWPPAFLIVQEASTENLKSWKVVVDDSNK